MKAIPILQKLGPGPVGLTTTIVMNLAGQYIFHRASSHFFTSLWWSDWFPNYIVWLTLTLVWPLIMLNGCGRPKANGKAGDPPQGER